INYLILLSEEGKIGLRKFRNEEKELLLNLINITIEDAEIVKAIETKGYEDILATNHDVKAIEYFIKLKLKNTSLSDILEYVHFCLTSEDINNLSYSLMIKDGFNNGLYKELINLYQSLYNLSIKYKDLPMLARTHGQSATPTTFGKEILVFVSRLKEELKLLPNIKLLSKLNGATGGYNAFNVVFPNVDWQKFSEILINNLNDETNPLNLSFNKVTTQIEPHDSLGRIFDTIKRINTILIDFAQDMWRYISDGWIKQRTVKGEIGSSAMPHKVNPIDFENGEGNLGMANSLFNFFSGKLMVSRLQRDLSDSTVLRNVGVAFAHTLLSYQSIMKGLSKIEVNEDEIINVLKNTPEIIAEAYQNILRVSGVEKPYELLKEVTRGKDIKIEDFHNLARKLNVSDKTKEKLLSITPENYTGLSSKIVEEFESKI
ncbi:MAG TPA: adenylosuccinate lyase, partial [Spirochaetota bacterium]|nr:adenylosuccinate lyase [Spirochaetota bacterium]